MFLRRSLVLVLALAAPLQSQVRNLDEALHRLQSARQSDPASIPLALDEARLLLEMKRIRQADELLNGLEAARPTSIDCLLLQAEIAIRLNEAAKAKDLLVRCTSLAPSNALVWKRLGDFYLGRKDEQALDCFLRAAKLSPQDTQAWAGIAAAKYQAGQIPAAEMDFQHAAALNRRSPKPNAAVSLLYADFLREGGHDQQSLAEYGQALMIDKNSTPARLGRGASLLRLEQWAPAQRDLELASDDPALRLQALNLLLKIYRAKGTPTQVSECAAQIEKLSAGRVRLDAAGSRIAAALQSADALFRLKKYDAAAQAYERIVDEYPEVASAYQGVANAFAANAQWQNAESAIRHYLNLETGSASGNALLGRILLAEKRIDEARAAFAAASFADPLLLQAQVGLAASEILGGNYGDAIRILRFATESPAAGIDARLMLVEALYKSHQTDQALVEVESVLKSDPSNPTAGRMRSELIAHVKEEGHK